MIITVIPNLIPEITFLRYIIDKKEYNKCINGLDGRLGADTYIRQLNDVQEQYFHLLQKNNFCILSRGLCTILAHTKFTKPGKLDKMRKRLIRYRNELKTVDSFTKVGLAVDLRLDVFYLIKAKNEETIEATLSLDQHND